MWQGRRRNPVLPTPRHGSRSSSGRSTSYSGPAAFSRARRCTARTSRTGRSGAYQSAANRGRFTRGGCATSGSAPEDIITARRPSMLSSRSECARGSRRRSRTIGRFSARLIVTLRFRIACGSCRTSTSTGTPTDTSRTTPNSWDSSRLERRRVRRKRCWHRSPASATPRAGSSSRAKRSTWRAGRMVLRSTGMERTTVRSEFCHTGPGISRRRHREQAG